MARGSVTGDEGRGSFFGGVVFAVGITFGGRGTEVTVCLDSVVEVRASGSSGTIELRFEGFLYETTKETQSLSPTES